MNKNSREKRAGERRKQMETALRIERDMLSHSFLHSEI